VLAILKANGIPFVIGGAVGASLQLGREIEGGLEVYVTDTDGVAALDAMSTAGFKIVRSTDELSGRIEYGEHTVLLRWGMPPPLGGVVDASWFEHARRVTFLDLRVRLAPVEELLWLRLATLGEAAMDDSLVDELILAHGATLDWSRFLSRLAGMEALVLSRLFLFRHRYPAEARGALPAQVLDTLLSRLNPSSSSSVVLPLR
jgi:hypothetical protein